MYERISRESIVCASIYGGIWVHYSQATCTALCGGELGNFLPFSKEREYHANGFTEQAEKLECVKKGISKYRASQPPDLSLPVSSCPVRRDILGQSRWQS